LRPKDEPKFRLKNWYINEPYRSIISINESVYRAIIKVFETSAKAVKVVIDGVEKTIDLASNILTGASTVIKTRAFMPFLY